MLFIFSLGLFGGRLASVEETLCVEGTGLLLLDKLTIDDVGLFPSPSPSSSSLIRKQTKGRGVRKRERTNKLLKVWLKVRSTHDDDRGLIEKVSPDDGVLAVRSAQTQLRDGLGGRLTVNFVLPHRHAAASDREDVVARSVSVERADVGMSGR